MTGVDELTSPADEAVAAFVDHCWGCIRCIGVMTIAGGALCNEGHRLYFAVPDMYDMAYAALCDNIRLTCDYSTPGGYTQPPEYCDNNADPGSVYCAAHRDAEDGRDDSDEPVWALEAD